MTNDKKESGNPLDKVNALLETFTKFIKSIYPKAKDAPTSQRILIYLSTLVIVVAFVGLLVPPYETMKQLIFVSIFLVFMLVLILVMNSISVSKSSRLFPLSSLKVRELHKKLEETRKAAFTFLKKHNGDLKDNEIRANIFFPECDASGKLNKNKLKIYSYLHINMDLPAEKEITFKPKQGATGQVFADGQKRVVQKQLNGQWASTYGVTNKLEEIINPNLKWIISMPLMDFNNKPIGVVNVDGLRCDFQDKEVINRCMSNLDDKVRIMTQVLLQG